MTVTCDVTISDHLSHYCDIVTNHVILSHTPPCSCKSKEKEKEKKRNINNDLDVLPSHDKHGGYQLICLISRPILIALKCDWHQSKGLFKGFP